jgi:hypothetical protein
MLVRTAMYTNGVSMNIGSDGKLGCSTELPMLEEYQSWKWLNKLFNDSASVGCANTASFNTV